MKVNELHRILGEHIAAGRGDDDVYLTLYDGPDEPNRAGFIDKHDWILTDVTEANAVDACVILLGEVEEE